MTGVQTCALPIWPPRQARKCRIGDVPDLAALFGSGYAGLGIITGEIAVIGDWNGDGRDKIGIYSDGYWVLDYNGNNAWDGSSVDRDVYWSWDSDDIPVVGNWNGLLNSTKIGVYSNGHWMADYDGNFILDGLDKFSFFGGVNSAFLPADGDWNDDGKTKLRLTL